MYAHLLEVAGHIHHCLGDFGNVAFDRENFKAFEIPQRLQGDIFGNVMT
jgi:hypothetical protein